MNYLINEAVNTGKGANAIISMLHFHLEHFGLDWADFFKLHF